MHLTFLPGRTARSAALLLLLAACQQTPTTPAEDKLASGSLLSIGQEHLVLQSEDHVMFVSLDETNKRQLQDSLKQGDKITILGKQEVLEVSPGHSRSSAEVSAIMKEDGTLIALNR